MEDLTATFKGHPTNRRTRLIGSVLGPLPIRARLRRSVGRPSQVTPKANTRGPSLRSAQGFDAVFRVAAWRLGSNRAAPDEIGSNPSPAKLCEEVGKSKLVRPALHCLQAFNADTARAATRPGTAKATPSRPNACNTGDKPNLIAEAYAGRSTISMLRSLRLPL